MKNRFKTVLTLIICGTILLSGCGTPTSSLPSALAGRNYGSPEAINIIAPFAFTASDADNAAQVEQQWLDDMSQRYNTRFTITHLTWKNGVNTDSDAAVKADNVLRGEEDFSGLVYINGIDDLQTSIENDTILPLEDLLADNPVWNALPDDLRATFEYQGHIYAVPTNVYSSLSSRYINNNALSLTGVNVTDLNSLKEFAVAYTRATGQSALCSYSLYELVDVINAFGLYSETPINSFGYDPGEDCIVDFLTKDAAVDALEYLRELYVTGVLEMTEDYGAPYEHFKDDTYPTYYGGSDKEDCTQLRTLNTVYPRVLHNLAGGFILTKSTAQPKETVNLFVNMLFGSEQNYLECWLGSPDHYILNSDGTITMKKVLSADGNYEYPCLPELTGGLPDVFSYSDAKILYSEGNIIDPEAVTHYQRLNEMLQNKTAVKIKPIYSLLISPSYIAVKYDVLKLYKNCIQDAITNTNWTVRQIVEDYRKDMLDLGGNVMLDEMNAAIGKKTAYDYN